MSVSRFVPILASFVVGAAASWWIMQPASRAAPEKSRDVATLASRPPEQITAPEKTTDSPSPAVGVPPDTVTPAKPALNAGQRRALARALDSLESNPPNVEARPVDPQAAAAFGDAMRAALSQENPQ